MYEQGVTKIWYDMDIYQNKMVPVFFFLNKEMTSIGYHASAIIHCTKKNTGRQTLDKTTKENYCFVRLITSNIVCSGFRIGNKIN